MKRIAVCMTVVALLLAPMTLAQVLPLLPQGLSQ